MSGIRRQSIISSGLVYIGFALGLVNTYLFTREGGFTPSQYGLIGAFIAIANIMLSFASLGMPAYVSKFYPYYKDLLKEDENDLMTWALLISMIGFFLVVAGGLVFKNLVIRKFGGNSGDLVKYYSWIFPYGFGLTLYTVLEAYGWQLKKSILTNYLREIQWRLFTTLLIVLVTLGVLHSYDRFVKFYSMGYILIALTLLGVLLWRRQLHLTFQPSKVTRRFFKKIVALCSLVWSGSLIFNIANFFDILVIAAVLPDGLAFAGIFTLGQNIAAIIQAPQRGIISASMGPLSRAWKDKDYDRISHIYHRSSINQLLFATGMFALIWMNFQDAVFTFHLQGKYLRVQEVFLFLGLMRVVDMGTGLNSQIISTSTFWRFEFYTGLILLAFSLPLNYILAKQMGVVGPAIATLTSMIIYNGIRYFFLLRRFGMQPFDRKTMWGLLWAALCFAVCHFTFSGHTGWAWIACRSTCFCGLYLAGILRMNLSPDILPVWTTILRRFGLGKNE